MDIKFCDKYMPRMLCGDISAELVVGQDPWHCHMALPDPGLFGVFLFLPVVLHVESRSAPVGMSSYQWTDWDCRYNSQLPVGLDQWNVAGRATQPR